MYGLQFRKRSKYIINLNLYQTVLGHIPGDVIFGMNSLYSKFQYILLVFLTKLYRRQVFKSLCISFRPYKLLYSFRFSWFSYVLRGKYLD